MLVFCPHVNTEGFWATMSKDEPTKRQYMYDDQAKLNFALLAMHPDWGETRRLDIRRHEKIATTQSGFKVTILSAKHACRKDCSIKPKSSYYIWHGHSPPGSAAKKAKNENRAGLWFLRDDWESHSSTALTGEQWLRSISEFV